MKPDRPFLSVLIPAYNEEDCLFTNVNQVLESLERHQKTFELIIVDDGSDDRTGDIAKQMANDNSTVRVIQHHTNLGIGPGVRTGIQDAKGEWFILIPADLALNLEELGKYFEATSNADVVVGIRSDRSDYSSFRRLVSWVNIRSIQLLFGMRERQFNYISMYRMRVLDSFDVRYWQSAFFYAEILIKAKALGYRLKEVEIAYTPRTSGKATGARFGFILRTAIDMLAFWLSWSTFGRRSFRQQRDLISGKSGKNPP